MKNNIKILLIIFSSVFGVLAIVSLGPILFSAMLFDAPGSEENNALLTAFFSLISFPIIVFITIGLAWIFYAIRKPKAALIIILLPSLNIILFIIGIALW